MAGHDDPPEPYHAQPAGRGGNAGGGRGGAVADRRARLAGGLAPGGQVGGGQLAQLTLTESAGRRDAGRRRFSEIEASRAGYDSRTTAD
jgi:hypothetical protein